MLPVDYDLGADAEAPCNTSALALDRARAFTLARARRARACRTLACARLLALAVILLVCRATLQAQVRG